MFVEPLVTGIIEGDQKTVEAQVRAALAAGLTPYQLVDDMLVAMSEVRRLYDQNVYSVPEMLLASRAMRAGLAALKQKGKRGSPGPNLRVAVGSVKGDLHDIGKNLVVMMLEGAGFEVIDLGADVPPEKFVEVVRLQGAQVIAMSALLTTTMGGMKTTVRALESAGLRQQVRVIIGGAPVSDAFAREIGADGYAPDASRAVSLVRGVTRDLAHHQYR
jgi:5-methyltetrahydrofolate--homocysteine methyltransferase